MFQVFKLCAQPEEGALFFERPLSILIVHEPGQVREALRRLDRARSEGFHTAGFLSYEAFDCLHQVFRESEREPQDPSQKNDTESGAGRSENTQTEMLDFPLLAFGIFEDFTFIKKEELSAFLQDWSRDAPFSLRELFPDESSHSSSDPSFERENPDPKTKENTLYGFDERTELARKRQRRDAGEHKAFLEALRRIHDELHAGNAYQINYTQKRRLGFRGSPISLFRFLWNLQPTFEAGLCVWENRALVSLSPESFLQMKRPCRSTHEARSFEADLRSAAWQDTEWILETRPMKGTMPRASEATEDRQAAKSLARDTKTRAENVMIVDLMRNDLGQVAKTGSVRVASLFSVETHPTLHQMTSLIEARIPSHKAERFYQDILPALFPSGSITGAPKLSAQKIIRSIENARRGAYTGSLGFVLASLPESDTHRPDNKKAFMKNKLKYCCPVQFNVLIRGFEIDRKKGIAGYGAGCGIVYDSEAEQEWQEYLLKHSFYSPALSGFHLIETMRIEIAKGEIPLLDQHLHRLESGLRRFGLASQKEIPILVNQIRNHITKKILPKAVPPSAAPDTSQFQKLRLCVPRQTANADFFIEIAPVPLRRHGLRLCLSPERIYSGDPYRGFKTSLRGIYDIEFARARKKGFDDALFLNERDELVETATCNLLFLDSKENWVSPAFSSGALPGVMLAFLSERRPIEFRSVSLEEFCASKRAYACNAVFGLRRIDLRAVRRQALALMETDS